MKAGPFSVFVRASCGATAVEFALILLPLSMLLFGIIESGRALWTHQAMNSAAAVGARCMGIGEPSCANSGTYSASKTTTFLLALTQDWAVPLTSANLALTHSATCAGITGFSQVTITFNFQSSLAGIIPAFQGGVPLSATACFPNQS